MKQVRSVLEETARALPWRDQSVDPTVRMKEFAGSSVNFTVAVGIEDPWQLRAKQSMLNEAIWFALKDAGIAIAFPQLDLHLDPALMEAPGLIPGKMSSR
jgi:potassium efflux system protein